MSEPTSNPPTPPPAPSYGKKVIVYLLVPALLIAGGWEGFRFAKLHLALMRAHREFAHRQYMRAEFWTGRALGVDERNIDATRLMAEINEAQDKPAALGWRIRVAQRNSGNAADIMAWAKSALRFGQVEMALQALKSLPQNFKDRSADYHELMAGCALAAHRIAIAEAHFLKATELDHDNPLHAVNLAAFRLTNSPDAETRAAARSQLERALTDARVNLFAIRALLGDAIRSGNREKARQFADQLHSLPEHNFSDDLTCLSTQMGGPDFQSALEAIEQRAESDPLWVTEAGEWLNTHGRASETVRWHGKLPEKIRSTVRVQVTISEAYLAMSDWTGLSSFLSNCHWDNSEYLRRAMIIRCKRELSQPWEKEWKQLTDEVDGHPPEGLLLAQLVIGWNWREEALDLLRGAANHPETQPQALEYLWDLYSHTNETRELRRIAKQQLDLDPTNPARKNNEAFLSLLLYGPSDRVERLAREAATANPNVPEWAATYAYALHLAGKDAEAKKVMDKQPADALARPGVALYYAIILAANGDQAQARETLSKLNPRGMLPEEQKLAAGLAQQLR